MRRAALLGLGAALACAAPAHADQVIPDAAIIQGAACTGLRLRHNEPFGTDSLRLKENNTRIAFSDTSVTGPGNDWELTANDTGSGGQNYLGVTDVSSARLPLRVLAGAPTDTLVVAPDGVRGALSARIGAATTENVSTLDGAALLRALGTLPIATYELGGTRRIGPLGTDFTVAAGAGAGGEFAVTDATAAALAAAQRLVVEVAAATRGPEGPAGPAGDRGVRGELGAPGSTDADHEPSAAALAAFNARLDKLSAGDRGPESGCRRRKRIAALT